MPPWPPTRRPGSVSPPLQLETLQQSIAALAAHGLAAQVTQIAVSRSKAAGSRT